MHLLCLLLLEPVKGSHLWAKILALGQTSTWGNKLELTLLNHLCEVNDEVHLLGAHACDLLKLFDSLASLRVIWLPLGPEWIEGKSNPLVMALEGASRMVDFFYQFTVGKTTLSSVSHATLTGVRPLSPLHGLPQIVAAALRVSLDSRA